MACRAPGYSPRLQGLFLVGSLAQKLCASRVSFSIVKVHCLDRARRTHAMFKQNTFGISLTGSTFQATLPARLTSHACASLLVQVLAAARQYHSGR